MSPHTSKQPTPERSLQPKGTTPAADSPTRGERPGGPVRRAVAASLTALFALVALTACAESPIVQEHDKWVAKWGIPEQVGQFDEDAIKTAAHAPCRYPQFDLPPNERNMKLVIKGLAATMMAVCPQKTHLLLQARLDQGPSSEAVRHELEQMLADVQG